MNYKTEDKLIEASLRIDQSMDELLGVYTEMEDSLQAVEDMKLLPQEVKESVQNSIKTAYADLICEIRERIGQDTDIMDELKKRRPVA